MNFLFIKSTKEKLIKAVEDLGGTRIQRQGENYILFPLKKEYESILVEYKPVEDFIISNRVTF